MAKVMQLCQGWAHQAVSQVEVGGMAMVGQPTWGLAHWGWDQEPQPYSGQEHGLLSQPGALSARGDP